MTLHRFETEIYNEILLEAERRKAADLKLLVMCKDLGNTATMSAIQEAIGRHYISEIPLMEKHRSVNPYNVFCQKERARVNAEKLAVENSFTETSSVDDSFVSLTPSVLSERYKSQTEDDMEVLEEMVSNVQAGKGYENLLRSGMTKAKVRTTFINYITAMHRFHGTETAVIFGSGKSWDSVAVGENVEKADLQRWRKEVRILVNPISMAQKARNTAAALEQSKEIKEVKDAIKAKLNAQCGTSYNVLHWNKMVKAETLGAVVPLLKFIVVKNWPLDHFNFLEIKKAHNIRKIKGSLDCLEFRLTRHFNSRLAMLTSDVPSATISEPSVEASTEPSGMAVDNVNE
ncbi:uncharacterized protein EV154DRAFT_577262 [Mucor mucedo]|uniref:uncharacterized protein n=1 Tax=Mucor mucedo TaxID=29922 RepID=UPI00221F0D95|nr:uncharacterized protein EV154DRAFT_577262 [Mucor mucedo]KAI7876318.1 hypothetical protein EV154DRAFT_577262 [Mucor mucedo]